MRNVNPCCVLWDASLTVRCAVSATHHAYVQRMLILHPCCVLGARIAHFSVAHCPMSLGPLSCMCAKLWLRGCVGVQCVHVCVVCAFTWPCACSLSICGNPPPFPVLIRERPALRPAECTECSPLSAAVHCSQTVPCALAHQRGHQAGIRHGT